MKVKVLRPFSFGGRYHQSGEVVEIEDSLVRRLLAGGMVETVGGIRDDPDPPAPASGMSEEEVEKLRRMEAELGEKGAQGNREIAPTWKPAPGQKLTGILREIRRAVKTRIGERDLLIVDTGTGKYSVWRSPSTEKFFRDDLIGKKITIECEPVWKPQPGEKLMGKIVEIRRGVKTRFGRGNDLMIIETPKGQRVAVWKKAVLEDYFNEENIGKLIVILYEGKVQGANMKYDKFSVKVGEPKSI
jgi:hypothetical protein